MNVTTPPPADHDPLDPTTAALAAAVLEISRHVEGEPLPRPRWFALAHTASLMAEQPGLAALLGDDAALALASDQAHLTPVELDDVPTASDPLDALADLRWPDIAWGGAVVCDLSAGRWRARPAGEPASSSGAAAPDTAAELGAGTIRAVAAATGDRITWSALRGEGAQRFVLGPALLPELVEVLAESLQAPGEQPDAGSGP